MLGSCASVFDSEDKEPEKEITYEYREEPAITTVGDVYEGSKGAKYSVQDMTLLGEDGFIMNVKVDTTNEPFELKRPDAYTIAKDSKFVEFDYLKSEIEDKYGIDELSQSTYCAYDTPLNSNTSYLLSYSFYKYETFLKDYDVIIDFGDFYFRMTLSNLDEYETEDKFTESMINKALSGEIDINKIGDPCREHINSEIEYEREKQKEAEEERTKATNVELAKEEANNRMNSWLNIGGTSRSCLITFLVEDGFNEGTATTAVDSIGFDWYEQAEIAGASYLLLHPAWTWEPLVEALMIEGFTYDEADKAAYALGVGLPQ